MSQNARWISSQRALVCITLLTLVAKAGVAGGEPAAQGTAWAPPTSADGPEWIRLSTGDWISGALELMRDDTIEFENPELGTLRLDWEIVEEFHSGRTNTFVLGRRRSHTGTVIMRDGVAIVDVAGETIEIARKDLLAIIPGEGSELNFWSLKAIGGITLRSGNTDQEEFTVIARLRREDTMTRGQIRYIGAIGQLDGETTVNNSRVDGFVNVFLSRRFFLTPISASFYFDELQNIDLRVTPGVGIGYALLDRGGLDLDLELGVGYQYTEYISVMGPGGMSNQTAVLLLGAKLDWNLTAWLTLDSSLRTELAIPDVRDTNSHLISILSADVYGPFTLDMTFMWDWLVDPVTDASGATPKSHDLALMGGFGIAF
ncbi:MAG: DUF481 domain-containing protein [Deltaproteobacteria bacterium]|nr:DUF481 domain-containing protein [Deltaproteobacteria bacterium]